MGTKKTPGRLFTPTGRDCDRATNTEAVDRTSPHFTLLRAVSHSRKQKCSGAHQADHHRGRAPKRQAPTRVNHIGAGAGRIVMALWGAWTESCWHRDTRSNHDCDSADSPAPIGSTFAAGIAVGWGGLCEAVATTNSLSTRGITCRGSVLLKPVTDSSTSTHTRARERSDTNGGH